MPQLTQERLKQILFYDPDTGLWRWLVDRGSARAGDKAGCPNENGYFYIKIDRRKYASHRLAFLYMLGRWPDPEVDHEDLNQANNRWFNLREATRQQQTANTSHKNSLGFKGITKLGSGRYRARIKVDGRKIGLGTRETAEEAHALYMSAALIYFGKFARAA